MSYDPLSTSGLPRAIPSPRQTSGRGVEVRDELDAEWLGSLWIENAHEMARGDVMGFEVRPPVMWADRDDSKPQVLTVNARMTNRGELAISWGYGMEIPKGLPNFRPVPDIRPRLE